jgi:hypothetical protein
MDSSGFRTADCHISGAMQKLILRIAMMCVSTAAVEALAFAEVSLLVKESPADAITNVGGAASFRVVVEAESEVSYQWFHDDQPVAAATHATLAPGAEKQLLLNRSGKGK